MASLRLPTQVTAQRSILWVYDTVNGAIQADGLLIAGQIAAADILQSGGHQGETFMFESNAPIGEGFAFETMITSFDNTISGEVFRFEADLAQHCAGAVLVLRRELRW